MITNQQKIDVVEKLHELIESKGIKNLKEVFFIMPEIHELLIKEQCMPEGISYEQMLQIADYQLEEQFILHAIRS